MHEFANTEGLWDHATSLKSLFEVLSLICFKNEMNISSQDEEFFYGGKRQNRRDVSKRANRDHKFAFDVVFGPQSTNEDVFRETTRDLVDVLFAGKGVSNTDKMDDGLNLQTALS